MIVDVIFGLLIGLFGLMIGLQSGGAFILHFTLRALLALNKDLPFRLVPMLEYATGNILLQRVGGSYRFVHTTFLEYFAAQLQETGDRG